MSRSRTGDYAEEGRRIATSLRLTYIASYIARGMYDMAADQLRFIDPQEQGSPSVIAAQRELDSKRSNPAAQNGLG